MGLILDKVAILSADKVTEKVKEIMEIWRTTGESIGTSNQVGRTVAVQSIRVEDNAVYVTLMEKVY
jgi:hypothetical protein